MVIISISMVTTIFCLKLHHTQGREAKSMPKWVSTLKILSLHFQQIEHDFNSKFNFDFKSRITQIISFSLKNIEDINGFIRSKI